MLFRSGLRTDWKTELSRSVNTLGLLLPDLKILQAGRMKRVPSASLIQCSSCVVCLLSLEQSGCTVPEEMRWSAMIPTIAKNCACVHFRMPRSVSLGQYGGLEVAGACGPSVLAALDPPLIPKEFLQLSSRVAVRDELDPFICKIQPSST